MSFLNNEKEDQYEWALNQLKDVVFTDEDEKATVKLPETFATDAEPALFNAISTVFPESVHILCVWHINLNVAKKCKNKFSDKEWTEFMNLWNLFVASTTPKDYDSNLASVTKVAKEHGVFGYLESTWLGRTEKFVSLFTSQTHHFGNLSTSRVEGSHFRAKRFLNGRNNDFITCFNSFRRFEEHQTNEIIVSLGIEKTKTLQGLPGFFKDLNGVISHFALKKLKAQYNLLPDSLQKACTHNFRGAWGLPCSHEIAAARDKHDYLSPELIQIQWHLIMEVAPENHEGLIAAARAKFNRLLELPEHTLRKLFAEITLLESGQHSLVSIKNAEVKLDTRGRPRATINGKAKRPASPQTRWKSNFELAEASKRPRVSKCSLCFTAGHNITTCPLRRAHISGPSTSTDGVMASASATSTSAVIVEDCSSSIVDEEEALLADFNDMAKSEKYNQLHEEEVAEDSFESASADSFDLCDDSEPDDDKDLCPFCDNPLPAAPSAKLTNLLATLLAMPNIRKGIGRAGAMSLPVSMVTFHTVNTSAHICFINSNSSLKPRIFVNYIKQNWRSFQQVLPKDGPPLLILMDYPCKYRPCWNIQPFVKLTTVFTTAASRSIQSF